MNENRPKGQAFVKRIYIPRIVGLGLGFFCAASVFYQKETHILLWLALTANGFLWPHIAYFIAKTSKNPYKAEIRNLLIDSFLGGVWVPLMSFNLLPSATVIFMMSMDNIATGGVRMFAKGVLAQLAGGLLAMLLFGLNIQMESTMLNVIACIPMLAAFPLTIGIITYRLTLKLSHQKRELEKVNIEIKDANDKLTGAYKWMRENRDNLIEHRNKEEIGFIVDREGKIEEITERAVECTGNSRAGLIGYNIVEFIDATCHEEFKNELRQAWMGITRNFYVVMNQTYESRTIFETTLTRLTSESRRALLVVLR